MFRALSAAAVLFAAAAPAVAQTPKLGVQTQIEFTDQTANSAAGRYMEFVYPIEQGDKFRIQVEAVKGADMKFGWAVYKDAGNGWASHETYISARAAKLDVTLEKGMPGRKAKIVIYSDSLGKATILISKVGDEPAEDAKDAKIKKLEAENAALKKKLDEVQQQLAEIKKLLEAKKP